MYCYMSCTGHWVRSCIWSLACMLRHYYRDENKLACEVIQSGPEVYVPKNSLELFSYDRNSWDALATVGTCSNVALNVKRNAIYNMKTLDHFGEYVTYLYTIIFRVISGCD